ncbi:MAG TPA: cytochrome c oxidase subunit 3 [Candidatus Binataceae bacterium]
MAMSAGAAAAISHAPGRSIASIPIGKLGVWWFLASEVMVFGGLIGTFVLMRYAHGGWIEDASHLNWHFAAINTFILVTSSLTMILALSAAKAANPGQARIFLGITILLGLSFLGVKTIEYSRELHEGFGPSSGLFWSFYFGMTGLHALHLTAGIVVNACLFVLTFSQRARKILESRIEFAGLYWHFVDIVWIFLFPTLYLT